MDVTKLLAIKHEAQIRETLRKAESFGGELWQTDPRFPKERKVCKIIQAQNDKERLLFRSSASFEVDPNYPVYIRLNYRNIIFRLSPGEFAVAGDKLLSALPDEARALEERKGGERFVLPFNANISVSVKRIEKTLKEMTYDMELRVIDVSHKGLGILISGQNREYLKRNDHFWLKSVDQSALRTPIQGHVCYVAPKGLYLKRGDVRVGVSLSSPLSKETFDYLKRQSCLVLCP